MDALSVLVSAVTTEATSPAALLPTDAAAGSSANGSNEVEAVTAYTVDVQSGEVWWTVKRRYSAFRELHEALVRAERSVELPPFPPKQLRHSEVASEQRRLAFQEYLQAVVAEPLLRLSWQVQHFLELPAHVRPAAATAAAAAAAAASVVEGDAESAAEAERLQRRRRRRRVLLIVPALGFDPVQAAVVWHTLARGEGLEVDFAAPNSNSTEGIGAAVTAAGDASAAAAAAAADSGSEDSSDAALLPDARMLAPSDAIERRLGADTDARLLYVAMMADASFQRPTRYADVDVADYGAVAVLGGLAGDAVRNMVEDADLHALLRSFWQLDDGTRPVGALEHGVLALANTTAAGGESAGAAAATSVIRDCKVMVLTQVMQQGVHTLTRLSMGDQYRPYPDTWMQKQVAAVLADPDAQLVVNTSLRRGTPYNDTHAKVLRDGRLLTGRGPGDAFLFARTLAKMMHERARQTTTDKPSS